VLTIISKENIIFKDGILVIKISGALKLHDIDSILKYMIINRRENACKITNLKLDLSDLYPISPAAATGLVCLCSALMCNKLKEIASPSFFYLYRPQEKVLSYLVSLGFFTQMSNNASLLGCEDLVSSEYKRKQSKVKKLDLSILNNQFNDMKPIVQPMLLIPQKDDSLSANDFENICTNYLNKTYDTFDKLFSSPLYNYGKNHIDKFYSANGELFMNIFQHSNSWGLGTIHAKPKFGTTTCYYDIGLGFKGSVNSSPKAGKEHKTFKTDCDAMKWALKEGNSAKMNGNGRGLTVVEEFVLEENGFIEIRSGCCLLHKKPGDKPGDKYWRVNEELPWFPGVQITYFVPSTTNIADS